MEIFVLGPVALRAGVAELVVTRPIERAALVRLAFARGRVVPDARLVADLWETGPGRRADRLWLVMSRLRATLGPYGERIERTAGGYRLDATVSDVRDAEAAAARIRAAARAGRYAEVRIESAAALRLWRGPALADITAPFAAAEARHLDELHLELTIAGLGAVVEFGAGDEVLSELTRLAGARPHHEPLARLLALARYRAGRPADALLGLARLRARLSLDLGVEPGAATVELEMRIRRHDPVLSAVRPGGVVVDAVVARTGVPRADTRAAVVSSAEGASANTGVEPIGAAKADRREESNGGAEADSGGERDSGARVDRGEEPDGAPGAVRLPGAVTALFGRDDDLAALTARLAGPGLVTVTGGPGSGKSRLALDAARRAVRAGRGVVFAEMATVPCGEVVAQAVAEAAGLGGAGELSSAALAALLDGSLLVLDNAEHLADGVGALAVELLGAAPALSILVTSQRPLWAPGEVIHRLGPLDRRSSLALFAARAGIALDESVQPHVVTICAAVDWLPLGIELAAGLTSTLSIPQLAQRIEDRVRLLVGGRPEAGGGRHGSLRAALDWSYELLDGATQSVLRRISVFAGGFPASAVPAVVGSLDPAQVYAALTELRQRNVLTVQTDGRYRRLTLLETIRDYAEHRLAAAGETEDTRARHTAWCLEHVRAADTGHGFGTAESVAAVYAEWPNIRAALDRAPGTAAAASGARLAVAMHRPWLMRARYAEAARYYERVLHAVEIGREERAEALNCWAFHALAVGRLDEAAELLDTTVELVADTDNPILTIGAGYYRGLIDIERARFAAAVESLCTAAELAAAIGDQRRESACLDACGTAQLFAGAPAEALAMYQRATELDRAQRSEHGLARGLGNQAKALLGLGRCEEALVVSDESDDYARRLDDRHMLAHNAQVRAAVAMARGRLDAAELHARAALEFMDDEAGTAEIDLADVLIARGALAEARTLLDRVAANTEPGRTTWLAARAVAAALAHAEGDAAAAADLVHSAESAYAATGFGWPRYAARLAAVRRQLTPGDTAGCASATGTDGP